MNYEQIGRGTGKQIDMFRLFMKMYQDLVDDRVKLEAINIYRINCMDLSQEESLKLDEMEADLDYLKYNINELMKLNGKPPQY